ncbi:MAG: MamI family restriction endonuclease [Paeniclostridium sp.]
MSSSENVKEALELLKVHHESFFNVHKYALKTLQPTPDDSCAWSQVLVSLLTGIAGLGRKKGPDLVDGSDVKAANTWGSIDTPRFNNVIKSGTKSKTSGKIESLDNMPYLFFVLWDNEPTNKRERVRVWAVRTKNDKLFRKMCSVWYELRRTGKIKSDNFQLQPPRNKNSNEFRNTYGNLNYPLLFSAIWDKSVYNLQVYNPNVLKNGKCTSV